MDRDWLSRSQDLGGQEKEVMGTNNLEQLMLDLALQAGL